MQLQNEKLHVNIVSLYGLHFANVLLPLLLIPYLARVLGPATWGVIALAQSMGAYLGAIIDYGFGLSATREVARERNNPGRISAILSGVLGAKLVLTVASGSLAVLALTAIPLKPTEFGLAIWGLGPAVAQAFSLTWYFQALEQTKRIVIIEISSRLVSVIMIVLLVRSPKDADLVFVIQGLCFAIATCAGFAIVYRHNQFKRPTVKETCAALRMGWSLFVFRGAASLYTIGNSFILSLFCPPIVVGYFAGAERIAKGFAGLFVPLNQALLPRFSNLMAKGQGIEARRILRASLAATTLTGALFMVTMLVWTDPIVRTVLGDGYSQTAGSLTIMAPLPILIGVSNVLGIQWMISLGLERWFNRILIVAGTVNIFLALILVPVGGHEGMSLSVLSAEFFVVSACAYLVWHTSSR